MASAKSILEQAKTKDNPGNRPWIKAAYSDPYGKSKDRVEFWVLEGSPPRGFIIAWSDGDVVRRAARLDRTGQLIQVFALGDASLGRSEVGDRRHLVPGRGGDRPWPPFRTGSRGPHPRARRATEKD